TGRALGESYAICNAVNLEGIQTACRQLSKSTVPSIGAIVDPSDNLAYAAIEGHCVKSYFEPARRTVIEKTAATPSAALNAIRNKTYWHFACHGLFSWQDARQSALKMAGQESLTVEQLLSADGVGHPRLVVLSACETGLYDISRNPDEFIGLPGAFVAL